MNLPSITLRFKEGVSDKVYSARIEAANGEGQRGEPGGRYIVTFYYGRAGQALKTGTKTSEPVGLPKAQAIYDKLVAEKTAKGYLPEGEAPEYKLTGEEGTDTGFRCQLLNEVEGAALSPMSIANPVQALLDSPEWCMQRKWDGERRGLRRGGAKSYAMNRKGQVVPLRQDLMDELLTLPMDIQLDGEDLGDRIVVFDILEIAEGDLRNIPYIERLQFLELSIPMGGRIDVAQTARTMIQKYEMFARAQVENWEGVVFKRLNAPYTPGRPASGGNQLKYKFKASCSCIVTGINDKRSVMLALVGDLNQEPFVPVGNVTIPPNHEIPKSGSVVEVEYLYAYPGGSLFQPVYKGVRSDVTPEECLQSQLKYKTAEA